MEGINRPRNVETNLSSLNSLMQEDVHNVTMFLQAPGTKSNQQDNLCTGDGSVTNATSDHQNAHQSHVNESTLKTTTGHQANMLASPSQKGSDRAVVTSRYWYVVIVISCFLGNFFLGGVANSFGVLYVYMMESLNVTEYQLSWIGALGAGSIGFGGFLSTVCVETIGCRLTTLIGGLTAAASVVVSSRISNLYLMYLTLGILPGFGIIMCFSATTVSVCKLYTRWLPVAMGVSVTGSAMGLLIWPVMTSSIADIMGWRGALLIHGAFLLHLVPASLWIRRSGKTGIKKESQGDKQCNTNCLQVFKLPGVLYFAIGTIFNGLAVYIFPTFTPQYAITSLPDVTSSDSSLIVSLHGAGTLIGRLLFSFLSMVRQDWAVHIYVITTFMCGITVLCVPLCRNMADFYIDGAFHGLVYGGWTCVLSVMLVRLFGNKNLAIMLGIFHVTQGMGAIGGPPLLSYLATVTNPDIIFYLAGCFYIVSAVVMLPLSFSRKIFVPGRRKSANIQVFTVRKQTGVISRTTFKSRKLWT